MTSSYRIDIDASDVVCIYNSDRKLIGTIDVADVILPGSQPAYLRVLSPAGPGGNGRVPAVDRTRLLLTIDQAARQLAISKSTMWKLIGSEDVKAVRLGPQIVRVESAELDAYLARLSGGS